MILLHHRLSFGQRIPVETTGLLISLNKNNVALFRIVAILIPVSGKTVATDGTIEFLALAWNRPAGRNISRPNIIVRATPSIMDKVDGLFRVKEEAQQDSDGEYLIESLFAVDHCGSNGDAVLSFYLVQRSFEPLMNPDSYQQKLVHARTRKYCR
jgi:hypothetical protein